MNINTPISTKEKCEKHVHFQFSSNLTDKSASEDEWKCDYCDAIIKRHIPKGQSQS